MTTATTVMIAFLGAILMIKFDTGGAIGVKFTLYVLLFIVLQKTIRRFKADESDR
jgi:hypothetical protein